MDLYESDTEDGSELGSVEASNFGGASMQMARAWSRTKATTARRSFTKKMNAQAHISNTVKDFERMENVIS